MENNIENSNIEQIYTIFISAFEIFKKQKRDPNNAKIKESLQELKLSKDTIGSLSNSQLQKYSLILVSPLEKCNIESMDVILSSMEQILFNKLLSPAILQQMVNKLIIYIPSYLRNNEIDYKINTKILHICEVIYGYKGLFVHNENLKTIIKIYLRIYLSMYNIELFQSQAQKTLSVIISKMISEMKECNISNKTYIGYDEINMEQNIEIDKKKKFLYKLQKNEFNYISNKYLDFLLDLIQIQSELENKDDENNNMNIIETYINLIKTSNYSDIKHNLEELNLSSYNIYYTFLENNKSYKIGKYG